MLDRARSRQTCMLGQTPARLQHLAGAQQPLGCSPAHQEHLLQKVILSEQKLRLGSNFFVARVLPKNYFHFKHKLKCKCHGTDEFRVNTAQLEGPCPRPCLAGPLLSGRALGSVVLQPDPKAPTPIPLAAPQHALSI